MRSHGTLTKWNDDRGFGFITPAKASADIFVHISAFPRDGVRPRLYELISFEVEAGADGKQRAVRVWRPGQKAATRPTRPVGKDHPKRTWARGVLTLLVVVALGAYGYSQYANHSSPAGVVESTRVTPAGLVSRPSPYSCDGRTMCSQMTSCAEATFFIRSCPNTQMDGDGDGVPCESQWCN